MPGFVGSPVKGALLPAVGSPSQESEQGHPSLASCLHKAVPCTQAASLQAPCHPVQATVQDSTLPAALLQFMRHLSAPSPRCMMLPGVTVPDTKWIMMLQPQAPPVQVQVGSNADWPVVHQNQEVQGMLQSHAH